ncbi:hypothetical protein CAC42_4560 [Sphaceloma murrayae]|uniref:J domain-containing protein n=1 Tax=Sphaceloma murrayae TaxID=2082308 RepID=A0A2K1QMN3_9PEZI|nr:hypothetical protein CAC42_4560 [Sphaceloma murrayae]
MLQISKNFLAALADLYTASGVSFDASPTDVRRGYRQACRRIASDYVHETRTTEDESDEAFLALEIAYEGLKCKEIRCLYDDLISLRKEKAGKAKLQAQESDGDEHDHFVAEQVKQEGEAQQPESPNLKQIYGPGHILLERVQQGEGSSPAALDQRPDCTGDDAINTRFQSASTGVAPATCTAMTKKEDQPCSKLEENEIRDPSPPFRFPVTPTKTASTISSSKIDDVFETPVSLNTATDLLPTTARTPVKRQDSHGPLDSLTDKHSSIPDATSSQVGRGGERDQHPGTTSQAAIPSKAKVPSPKSPAIGANGATPEVTSCEQYSVSLSTPSHVTFVSEFPDNLDNSAMSTPPSPLPEPEHKETKPPGATMLKQEDQAVTWSSLHCSTRFTFTHPIPLPDTPLEEQATPPSPLPEPEHKETKPLGATMLKQQDQAITRSPPHRSVPVDLHYPVTPPDTPPEKQGTQTSAQARTACQLAPSPDDPWTPSPTPSKALPAGYSETHTTPTNSNKSLAECIELIRGTIPRHLLTDRRKTGNYLVDLMVPRRKPNVGFIYICSAGLTCLPRESSNDTMPVRVVGRKYKGRVHPTNLKGVLHEDQVHDLDTAGTPRCQSIEIKIGRSVNVLRRLSNLVAQCGHDSVSFVTFSSFENFTTPSIADQIPCEDVARVERLLHLRFDNTRVDGKQCQCKTSHREWFDIATGEAAAQELEAAIRDYIEIVYLTRSPPEEWP